MHKIYVVQNCLEINILVLKSHPHWFNHLRCTEIRNISICFQTPGPCFNIMTMFPGFSIPIVNMKWLFGDKKEFEVWIRTTCYGKISKPVRKFQVILYIIPQINSNHLQIRKYQNKYYLIDHLWVLIDVEDCCWMILQLLLRVAWWMMNIMVDLWQ